MNARNHPLPAKAEAIDATEPQPGITDDSTDQPRIWKRWQLVPLVIAVIAAVVLATVSIVDRSNVRALPVEGSPEAGFVRDMSTHHLQAVEMSELVRGRIDDDEIRQLAFDIATTQLSQIGRMQGWLDVWGLPAFSADPPMQWMGEHPTNGAHGGDQPAMPGMATDEQVDELRRANGSEADALFLQLMIPHHRGGVAMANAVLEQQPQREVRQLAEAIVTSQQAEIDTMQQLLQQTKPQATRSIPDHSTTSGSNSTRNLRTQQ